MANKPSEHRSFDWPLVGRCRLDVDPAMLSPGDFQQLTNMRYTPGSPRGISGMTPINANATSYLRIDGGFHFKKDQPVENHVIAQTTAANSASLLVKSDGDQAIPLQDTFSTFQALTGSNAVNFSDAPDTSMVALDGVTNYIWGGNEYRCAKFINFDANAAGFLYDFTDQVNNTLNDANNRATLKRDAANVTSLYIGSTRPLKGVKFYVGAGNTGASTPAVTTWNGSSWATVGALTDTTATGGATMAKTGSISWASTVSMSKVTVVENVLLYYYKLTFSAGIDDDITVYYCTVDAPNQPIVDLWDGIERSIIGCFLYTTTYEDNIANVLKRDYYQTDTLSYIQVGGLTSSRYIYLGFNERLIGLNFYMPDANRVNTTAATTMTVSLWTGAAWSSVGTLADGTLNGAISLGHTGIVTWNQQALTGEFSTRVSSLGPLYWYRISFDKTLSADVRVDYITGIPRQQEVKPYKFPMLWQNRLWLLNDQVQYKNAALCSAQNTCCVFNGNDSTLIPFGDDKELMCGASLFTRFGSNLYDNAVVFKRNATFLVDGTSPADYRVYTVSDLVGCVAPRTLVKCDTNYEVAPGITKHVLLFMSNRGIEFFDGNTITMISEDIKTFFDPDNANYINTSIVDQFYSFFDSKNQEYHFLFATGSSTVLNKEWSFDLRRKKWFEVSRGTGKALRSGWSVQDSYGNKYVYCGTTDGFIERLENGTAFDGNAIVHTLWTNDSPLPTSNNPATCNYVTTIRFLRLIAKTKNTSTNKVTMTHYGDGQATGTAVSSAISQASTRRIYRFKQSLGQDSVFHSLKLTVTTNNEQVGFEPLILAGLYEFTREDIIGD